MRRNVVWMSWRKRSGKKENRIAKLEVGTNDLQQYSRRSSLRIFGVPEKSDEDTDQIVCDIAMNKLGIPISCSDIDRSHRTGKLNRESKRHRPIIAKFCSYRKRTEVIKARKKLKNCAWDHNPGRSYASECRTILKDLQETKSDSSMDERW